MGPPRAFATALIFLEWWFLTLSQRKVRPTEIDDRHHHPPRFCVENHSEKKFQKKLRGLQLAQTLPPPPLFPTRVWPPGKVRAGYPLCKSSASATPRVSISITRRREASLKEMVRNLSPGPDGQSHDVWRPIQPPASPHQKYNDDSSVDMR
jgi:hypothetical protein